MSNDQFMRRTLTVEELQKKYLKRMKNYNLSGHNSPCLDDELSRLNSDLYDKIFGQYREASSPELKRLYGMRLDILLEDAERIQWRRRDANTTTREDV